MIIEVPRILNLPPKLMPMVTDFARYKFIVIEGGRGSGKTQAVGRLLSVIADQVKVRVFCGREVQNTIDESVHAVLADLIISENLAFRITQKRIEHYYTGSEFKFKGFREQGAVNIKGVEGADIIWIDEAQTVTKKTLDMLIPTIRKNNSKLIFTMNRYMRDDAVIAELVGRPDCLHIKINYFENPFCPLTLKNEAEVMRNKSERDYRHIWLGEPLATADDYLFNFDKIYRSLEVKPFGDLFYKQRVMGIDFAAQGNDQCVATILDRLSAQHWQLTERIAWDEPDTMVSVGKIVYLAGLHKPDVIMLDVGGMGKPVYDRLMEVQLKNLYPFDGSSTYGIDIKQLENVRADGYMNLRDWFDQGFLKVDQKDIEVLKQLEKIKFKYRSSGSKVIQRKVDMKKEMGHSPDDADSLMMAVYGAIKHLGKNANTYAEGQAVRRINRTRRGR